MVSFKWRHWGVMQGPLRCPLGHGQELSAAATGQKIQARRSHNVLSQALNRKVLVST